MLHRRHEFYEHRRTGKARPRAEYLDQLAEMLDTTPARLMFGQEGIRTTNGELKSFLDDIAMFLENHPKEFKRFKLVNEAMMKGTE